MKKKEKEKQKDETDEEAGAETDEKQGSLLASTETAGSPQRLWWGSPRDFVQKAGLPVGAVSGSASPDPACVRARAGRPDRGHGGLFRVAEARPQPGSASTQGTR